uniref:C-type lectin domain-containing protein n=1 Tax=Sander lucioperca TaxID=283035 RepID=A0A8C9Z821_SANLU
HRLFSFFSLLTALQIYNNLTFSLFQHCVEGSCPPGWTQFGSRCFSFNFQGKSWIFCKAAGGNLASVHSEEEYSFLKTYIKQVSGVIERTWMGGFDSVQEGVWIWAPGKPDNAGGVEHCLENYQDKWNDNSCPKILPFACSKNM